MKVLNVMTGGAVGGVSVGFPADLVSEHLPETESLFAGCCPYGPFAAELSSRLRNVKREVSNVLLWSEPETRNAAVHWILRCVHGERL